MNTRKMRNRSLVRGLRESAEAILDLLYPQGCRGCGGRIEGGRPCCEDCGANAERVAPPFCSKCGEPFEGRVSSEFRCSNCGGLEFAFDFAVAAYRSRGWVRDLIHKFKYERDFSLRGVLGKLAMHGLDDPRLACTRDWVLAPVPLHPRRLRERGFNQAHEICRVMRRELSWPLVNPLRRTRYTPRQASLSRAQRLENMRGAFDLRRLSASHGDLLKSRGVLLVDDVLTTGATADACARVLRERAGAQKVVVLTVARG